jgi:hypothetical protein
MCMADVAQCHAAHARDVVSLLAIPRRDAGGGRKRRWGLGQGLPAAGGDGEGWAEWRRAEAVQGHVQVRLGNVLRALGSCSPW